MLFERLLSRDEGGEELERGIDPEFFYPLLCEVARGRKSGVRAIQDIAEVTGQELTPEEIVEAQALLATVLAPPSISGKLERAHEVETVLTLARRWAPGYTSPAVVKSRLMG